jgi:EAL domain-containing protein (putative c-di-GMP-specific phosphodiesterase class I)
LAKSLQVPVLAEGVETEAQRLFLKCEGCDQIQGYLLGMPQPISDYDGIVNLVSIAKKAAINKEVESESSLPASYSTKRPRARRRSMLS